MHKILLVLKREYFLRIKKRSFLLLTFLAPILLAGVFALIGILNEGNKKRKTIAVIDSSELFVDQLKSSKYLFFSYQKEKDSVSIKKQIALKQETFDGLLTFPANKSLNFIEKNISYYSSSHLGFEDRTTIENQINHRLTQLKLKNLGYQSDDIKKAQSQVALNLFHFDKKANPTQNPSWAYGIQMSISVSLMYAVMMFIIIYGVNVMRSVLEEKTNRVVEVLLGSIRPFELMMGKILGVALVALTQFVIWIGMVMGLIFGLSLLIGPLNKDESVSYMSNLEIETETLSSLKNLSDGFSQLNIPLIAICFLAFFALGYLLYSAFYAAIGAAVDSDTETNQFTIYATIPIVLASYGSINAINNPEGPIVLFLSLFPFTSPITMVARLPFGVPLWQLSLSLLILILTTLVMVFIASKIYRIGILAYGKKINLKTLFLWIKKY